jgi:hypothetical protein
LTEGVNVANVFVSESRADVMSIDGLEFREKTSGLELEVVG